jgi:hypothetical protein
VVILPWPHLRLTGLPRFLIERVSADFRRGFVFKAFRLGLMYFFGYIL